MDSIFRGYDLPKFYLNQLTGNAFFDYEVCDGQQRLRTIWEFLDNKFTLAKDTIIDGRNLSGKLYSQLDGAVQEQLNSYKLTYATIVEATHEEIRDLFARLQKGMGLNQAELRRALSTNIGVYVETIVQTHVFFHDNNSRITDVRNKHQDYIDHVIGYLMNNFDKDLKGQSLRDVYTAISPEKAAELIKQTTQVLDQLQKINVFSPGLLKNKWAFVDTFILVHQNLLSDRTVAAKQFASEFLKFEALRKSNKRNVGSLIEKENPSDEDKRLYTYITAFDKDGNLKNNLRRRNEVFTEQFGYLFT